MEAIIYCSVSICFSNNQSHKMATVFDMECVVDLCKQYNNINPEIAHTNVYDKEFHIILKCKAKKKYTPTVDKFFSELTYAMTADRVHGVTFWRTAFVSIECSDGVRRESSIQYINNDRKVYVRIENGEHAEAKHFLTL